MHRAPTRPERLFLQFHGSVYRSDDEGGSWNDIHEGPARAGSGSRWRSTRRDPDSAFVIPLVADVDRVTPEGKVRVYEDPRRRCLLDRAVEGLPGQDAYLTIYRQAFGLGRGRDELQLYFGATSGDVFGSADAGASWFSAHERLAPVTSVRVA